MKNIFCAALVFFALGMSGIVGQASAEPLKIGDQITEELGIGLNGRKVRVSDHQGKVMLISFWTSTCAPCQQELPMINHLQQLAGKANFSVIAINHGDRSTVYKRYVGAIGTVSMIFSHDRSANIGQKYFGVETVPHMIIVDHEGKIAYVHSIFDDRSPQTLAVEINELLNKQAAAR